MALKRPSLSELITQTAADIQSRLPGSDPLKRFSVLGALARTLAYGLHGLYGLLDYFARQANPATSTGQFLDLWASIWGITRLAAARATGAVDLTGQPNTYVPLGLQLQDAGGIEYRTTASDSLGPDGTVTVAIEAADTGPAANLVSAIELSLINPTSGINSRAYVAAGGISGGSAVEADERLRTRLKQRIQYPPHGGALHDYERWALEVSGVDQVWPVPLYSGDGTVQVWIGETDYEGATLASASLVASVQSYIESPERKPVTAAVTVAAPTVVKQDIAIALVPDQPDVQQAVIAELEQLFARDAEPEGKILISRIRESVSIAAGESDNAVTSPTADVSAGVGEILALGTVTFS